MTDIKNRVVDFRRRLYADRDLTAVDDYIHPDFRSHNPLVKPGRDAYRAFAAGFFRAFPIYGRTSIRSWQTAIGF